MARDTLVRRDEKGGKRLITRTSDANHLIAAYKKSAKSSDWKTSVQHYEYKWLANISRTQKELDLVVSYFDEDFLDLMEIIEFALQIQIYEETLQQSDNDDIMNELDNKTSFLIKKLEVDLENQNEMLKEILTKLNELEEKIDDHR